MVLMIAMKTTFLPLKWNFARPYPQRAEKNTVVTEHVIATISELSIALKKIWLLLFPRMALTKLVRNVLEEDVK